MRLAVALLLLVGAANANAQTAAPSGLTAKIDVAAGFRQVYDVSIGGAEVSAGLGGQWRHLAFYFVGTGLIGATDRGLTTGEIQVDSQLEGRFDRVRFGGGLQGGLLDIRRATTGGHMQTLAIGPELHASYDLVVSHRGGALFVFARLGADLLWPAEPSTVTFNGAAGLGYRY